MDEIGLEVGLSQRSVGRALVAAGIARRSWSSSAGSSRILSHHQQK